MKIEIVLSILLFYSHFITLFEKNCKINTRENKKKTNPEITLAKLHFFPIMKLNTAKLR